MTHHKCGSITRLDDSNIRKWVPVNVLEGDHAYKLVSANHFITCEDIGKHSGALYSCL